MGVLVWYVHLPQRQPDTIANVSQIAVQTAAPGTVHAGASFEISRHRLLSPLKKCGSSRKCTGSRVAATFV